jgi:hypothetical protein
MARTNFNLLRRIRTNIIERHSKGLWGICKNRGDKKYFLQNFSTDDDDNTFFMWTKNKDNAMFFESRNGVTDFIKLFFKNANDIGFIKYERNN